MATGIQTKPTSTIEVSPDGTVTHYSFFEANETVLRELISDLFVNQWSKIVFGPIYEGAIFEIQFQETPKVTYSDGYLTADLGAWHFHLCLGQTKACSSEELREKRPAARAALYERKHSDGHGLRTWGLRLWNGYGEQMITILLPNAFLSDDRQKILKDAVWNKLELYYQLRNRLLGESIPADYQAAANQPWPESVA